MEESGICSSDPQTNTLRNPCKDGEFFSLSSVLQNIKMKQRTLINNEETRFFMKVDSNNQYFREVTLTHKTQESGYT